MNKKNEPKGKSPDDTAASSAFSDFIGEFVMESDRAAVILGAARIDSILCKILDKFLLPNPSAFDDLLEGDSPLSTFSARIKICHRLGLIDDQFSKMLNTFRRLRNGFAHEVSQNSLNSGSARDRVISLAEPILKTSAFLSSKSLVAKQLNRDENDVGVIFRATLAVMHIYLDFTLEAITPVSKQIAVPISGRSDSQPATNES